MADVVKYGIQIPNRVFVGGVAFDTKEEELKEFFTQYGKIKECKIIKDSQSISRGFAFVTFECKHDATQTQQLGTVFFNQKKLNLGPAIRQKGVVFNGANEFENEPVLSTGVYIHPSGYSYTVAPNGVWYFHNSDGSPRARSPGTPQMSYSPNLVTKIQQSTQEIQSVSPTPVSNITAHNQQIVTNTMERDTCTPVPVLPSTEPPPVQYQPAHYSVPDNTQQQHNGYVHHPHSATGSPNIHVAFQNMSISHHPAAAPGHHVHIASNPVIQSPVGNQVLPMTTSVPQIASPHIQYARVGDMVIPYYSSPPTVKHANFDGSPLEHRQTNVNAHCHYPVPIQKQGYYAMMPNNMRDSSYVYPVCDPCRPAYVYPQPGYNMIPVSESPQCYKKKMVPRYSHAMKSHGKYGNPENNSSTLNIDTKCA